MQLARERERERMEWVGVNRKCVHAVILTYVFSFEYKLKHVLELRHNFEHFAL